MWNVDYSIYAVYYRVVIPGANTHTTGRNAKAVVMEGDEEIGEHHLSYF